MSFCGSCGAPVAAAQAGGQPSTPGPVDLPPIGSPVTLPPQAAPPPVGTPMASNVAGMLTYVLGFITGIIFLVLEPYKNDSFVRFHAFQSILYSAVAIAFSVLWNIFSSLVGIAFGSAGHLLLLVVWLLVRLCFFLGWLFL